MTVQTAPGPQGEGSHGSGFSTQRCAWQMKPLAQSGSRTHSGLQPEIVSGNEEGFTIFREEPYKDLSSIKTDMDKT